MAAMIVSRRFPVAKLLDKLLAGEARLPPALSTLKARSFNTNTQRTDLEDDRSIDIDRRGGDTPLSRRRDRDLPGFFSDVFDPFTPTRSLSQVLNLMDQMMDTPFIGNLGGRNMTGSGVARRGWDAREDDNALYLRIDMPGLSKEHVRVTAEQGTLVIKGEGGKESDDDDESSVRRYSSRIDLPEELYKMDQIRAEMKNGILKIVVPKVKEEERKDVHQVQIE